MNLRTSNRGNERKNIVNGESKNRIAVLLLHAGLSDPDSAEVLEILGKSGNQVIVPIEISDNSSLNLIQYNTMGITVTELPSIVIAQEGLPTQIYPGSSINSIIDLTNSIVMNQETAVTNR